MADSSRGASSSDHAHRQVIAGIVLLGGSADLHLHRCRQESHTLGGEAETHLDSSAGGSGRGLKLRLDRGEETAVPSTVVNQRYLGRVAQRAVAVQERDPGTH